MVKHILLPSRVYSGFIKEIALERVSMEYLTLS